MKNEKKKILYIPKGWFFFNPTNDSNDKYFLKISKKTGVIFFYENKDEEKKFLKKVNPYICLCQDKGISFIIQSSIYWANKYNAFGILFDQNNPILNNKLHINSIKKNFLIAGKVHNFKEAIGFGTSLNLVFISNVFETKTYPKKKKLSMFSFFSLCNLLKRKKVFALGGINKNNFKKLKNKHLYGFGAISYFRG